MESRVTGCMDGQIFVRKIDNRAPNKGAPSSRTLNSKADWKAWTSRPWPKHQRTLPPNPTNLQSLKNHPSLLFGAWRTMSLWRWRSLGIAELTDCGGSRGNRCRRGDTNLTGDPHQMTCDLKSKELTSFLTPFQPCLLAPKRSLNGPHAPSTNSRKPVARLSQKHKDHGRQTPTKGPSSHTNETDAKARQNDKFQNCKCYFPKIDAGWR